MTRRIPTDEVEARIEALGEVQDATGLAIFQQVEFELLENLLESRQALGDLLQTTEEVNELRKIWDRSD